MDRVTDEHSSTSIVDGLNGMDGMNDYNDRQRNDKDVIDDSKVDELGEIVCWMKVRFEMQSMN